MWIKRSAPGDKCGGAWRHTSGWEVRHCGHPTANWPYYIEHPDRKEIVVSFNGLGFKTSKVARGVVEMIVTGSVMVSTENCVANVATVNATAMGLVV
jgi:hypothetical protein